MLEARYDEIKKTPGGKGVVKGRDEWSAATGHYILMMEPGMRQLGSAAQPAAHCSTRLATTHHSFLGSFSAVSKRNFATKYAFFQVFRDLQNYLADFLKKLQNFAKNRKKLQKFCEISGFLQKKSADFCENR